MADVNAGSRCAAGENKRLQVIARTRSKLLGFPVVILGTGSAMKTGIKQREAVMQAVDKVEFGVVWSESDEVADLTERLVQADAERKRLADECKRLKDRLLVKFAEGHGMVFAAPSGAVTITRVAGRRSLDKKLVQAALGADEFEACHKQGSPTLRVTVKSSEVK